MVFSCISGGCLLSTSSYLHDSIIIYFFQAFRIRSTFDMFSCLFDVFLFYFYFFMFSSAVTFSTISVFDTFVFLV
jgi:hypothetical protein